MTALCLLGGVAAQFTHGTSSAPQQIGTGTVALSLDNVSPVVWTDDISNLAAGDTVQRFVDVRNSGSLKTSGMTVSQINTLGDLLTSPSDIIVTMESCTVAWNYHRHLRWPVGNGSCRVIGLGLEGPGQGCGRLRRLRCGRCSPPEGLHSAGPGATNTVQAKSGTITYTFGTTQRTAGDSSSTSSSATPLQQAGNVTTTPVSPTSVKVDFTDTNAGTAGYVISWGETGNSAVAPQQMSVPAGQNSATVTGLTEGASYDFSVISSKNGQTASSVATTAPAPGPVATPVQAPTGLKAVVQDNAINVSFNAATPETDYSLTYTPRGGTPTTQAIPAGTTSYSILAPRVGVTYDVALTASLGGKTAQSDTSVAVPMRQALLSTSAITPTGMSVQWTDQTYGQGTTP